MWNKPLQSPWRPAPVSVYPLLQVHFTELSPVLCEQTAFESQPPLFTWQLSTTSNRRMMHSNIFVSRYVMWNKPLQFPGRPAPVSVYPLLQVHFTELSPLLWEQTAFESQPPLFTWQLSTARNKRTKYLSTCFQMHAWIAYLYNPLDDQHQYLYSLCYKCISTSCHHCYASRQHLNRIHRYWFDRNLQRS